MLEAKCLPHNDAAHRNQKGHTDLKKTLPAHASAKSAAIAWNVSRRFRND